MRGIAFFSLKGGVGNTTTSVNIAVALARVCPAAKCDGEVTEAQADS